MTKRKYTAYMYNGFAQYVYHDEEPTPGKTTDIPEVKTVVDADAVDVPEKPVARTELLVPELS